MTLHKQFLLIVLLSGNAFSNCQVAPRNSDALSNINQEVKRISEQWNKLVSGPRDASLIEKVSVGSGAIIWLGVCLLSLTKQESLGKLCISGGGVALAAGVGADRYLNDKQKSNVRLHKHDLERYLESLERLSENVDVMLKYLPASAQEKEEIIAQMDELKAKWKKQLDI